MKKLLKGTRQVITEDNHYLNLEYYLVETNYVEQGTSNTAYGIEIMKEFNGEVETDIVQKITSHKDEAMQIMDKLIANTVTPMSMVIAIDELCSLKI
ncbi:hypothetical protein HZI73_06640 [Vallitalea pronyensis]|uniref:Uncharacterized protein n=1 Tax=Vallitalea pronyensis TaxID=1348613 RepID=A0A8J8MID9_9FIRM|nr:DUF6514 family protein [Vallitalea pronyensis]QUI21997.1 hypothetical protein HZI73_06640 [Vallitalea pronyensis]